jgi:hypothetical protein
MDRRLAPHTQRIVEAEIAKTMQESVDDPERPKGRVTISITDQQGLLQIDPRRILTGEIEVRDTRPAKRR